MVYNNLMKNIIFSDIHSNFEALSEFVNVIDNLKKADARLICLGDIIGYGASPSECLEYVKSNADIVLSGNHERMIINPSLRMKANEIAYKAIIWTENHLNDIEKKYIENFREQAVLDNKCLAVHGSPINPDQYILRSSTATQSIKKINELNLSICFFGHTHLPGIFDDNGRYFYEANSKIKLIPGRSYLINPGSIGQPRDGDSRSSFCVFDDIEFSVDFYRFQYNVDQAAKKIIKNGLPEELAERLYFGR